MNPVTESRLRKLRGILALAAAYAVAARVGLELDAVSGGFATLVWPPTGIAIAALLLFGTSYWPGVFVGAVVANILVGAPLVRLGIGVGNTLEAVAAAYALRHLADFDVGLARLRSVVAFVLVCIVATSISATVGVASLVGGGMVASPALAATWRAWWLGDLVGALVVAPIILVWHSRDTEPMDRRDWIELASLIALVALAATTIFFSDRDELGQPFLQSYVIFPALILVAARLATRGAASSVLVTSAIAVWGTALQRGPFARPTLHESLINLQAFMGIVATTLLVLGATIAERRTAMRAAERARREAEGANRAKADFMAMISHELRTPLNAISGYVDLLLSGAHGALNAKQLDSLQRINRNYQHLLTLIDDVLGFTRAETGRLTIKTQPVRVGDVIDAVEAVIEPEVRHKQIAFRRDNLDASLAVLADPEKLRQIVVNLVTNAVKYTDPGGSVAIDADAAEGRVRIRVVDSGIGIPADQLPRVFDPFFQVDRGTARRYPGIGLGLTISRDLAIAMQGEILITSTLGQGTTVVVLLPRP